MEKVKIEAVDTERLSDIFYSLFDAYGIVEGSESLFDILEKELDKRRYFSRYDMNS